MKSVIIYSKNSCPYCLAAKDFFSALEVPYTEVNIDEDSAAEENFLAFAKKHKKEQFPLIVIEKEYIGSYDDLMVLQRAGKLKEKLQK